MVDTLNILKQEIAERKKEYKTDSYSMSVGELVNLYRDGEIKINPDFQRFFRWDIFQKTSLIESILLGIPIPPIFVYQTDDGRWELVDGLQRVSTLLEFMGQLKKEDETLYAPSELIGTEQLPSLEGVKWTELQEFSPEVCLEIKRARIMVEIIKKESDKDAKFEVFQRLNANGSQLSAQEKRNSLLVMINKHFFEWLKELVDNEHFQTCINVPERLEQEQYSMELILRYLVLLHFEATSKELVSINEFITKKMKLLARDTDFDYTFERERFNKTFQFIENTHKKNAFRRFDIEKGKYVGAFLESIYDPVVVGIAFNISDYEDNQEDLMLLKDKIQSIWQEEIFIQNRKPGISANHRIPKLIPFAKEHFRKNA